MKALASLLGCFNYCDSCGKLGAPNLLHGYPLCNICYSRYGDSIDEAEQAMQGARQIADLNAFIDDDGKIQ